MKPHPRIRKAVKWGGAVVSVLLVVVWVGSGWRGYGWWISGGSFGGRYVGIEGGQLRLVDDHTLAVFQGSIDIVVTQPKFSRPEWHWWFGWEKNLYTISLGVPLWLFVAFSLAVAGAAWYLDTLARRRARIGLCPKCNYDRTGLAAGAVCPECGEAPASV